MIMLHRTIFSIGVVEPSKIFYLSNKFRNSWLLVIFPIPILCRIQKGEIFQKELCYFGHTGTQEESNSIGYKETSESSRTDACTGRSVYRRRISASVPYGSIDEHRLWTLSTSPIKCP